MLELTEVEACDLADLFKSVNKSVSMYEELSRGFGNVEVILEEALNGHKGLAVERLEASLLEYLLEEHLAESGRKLIDKSADTEVFVAYDVLLGLENLADVESYLSLLISARKILEVIYYGRNTDIDLGVELGGEGIGDVGSDLLDILDVGVGLNVLNENDVVLANADNVVLALIGEHILEHFKGHYVGLTEELDKENDSALLVAEMKLLGFNIDIAGKDVVENDILDEESLIVLFVVKVLDIAERYSQKLTHLLSHLILALHEYDVLVLGANRERTVGITAGNGNIGRIGKLVANTLLDLTDLYKISTRDNYAILINNTDHTVNRGLHLMNYVLKQSVCHFFTSFMSFLFLIIIILRPRGRYMIINYNSNS